MIIVTSTTITTSNVITTTSAMIIATIMTSNVITTTFTMVIATNTIILVTSQVTLNPAYSFYLSLLRHHA